MISARGDLLWWKTDAQRREDTEKQQIGAFTDDAVSSSQHEIHIDPNDLLCSCEYSSVHVIQDQNDLIS